MGHKHVLGLFVVNNRIINKCKSEMNKRVFYKLFSKYSLYSRKYRPVEIGSDNGLHIRFHHK